MRIRTLWPLLGLCAPTTLPAAAAPFARLPSVNGVPEVLDTATGLVWRRCAKARPGRAAPAAARP
jgi:hypothetical protein